VDRQAVDSLGEEVPGRQGVVEDLKREAAAEGEGEVPSREAEAVGTTL